MINCSRETKYDKTNTGHEKELLKLWDTLMPNTELTNRISNDWIKIGFQANDPATDFRGAGILGLQQLVSMVCWSDLTKRKVVHTMYKDSTNEQHWYFFCCAGLNITGKLINCLQPSQERREECYKSSLDEAML